MSFDMTPFCLVYIHNFWLWVFWSSCTVHIAVYGRSVQCSALSGALQPSVSCLQADNRLTFRDVRQVFVMMSWLKWIIFRHHNHDIQQVIDATRLLRDLMQLSFLKNKTKYIFAPTVQPKIHCSFIFSFRQKVTQKNRRTRTDIPWAPVGAKINIHFNK